jgi:hypothetical protein
MSALSSKTNRPLLKKLMEKMAYLIAIFCKLRLSYPIIVITQIVMNLNKILAKEILIPIQAVIESIISLSSARV